jgi:mannose/cellobiose epimerase-like protein (N-acyl-D-glucosamine 2-epimerase family)
MSSSPEQKVALKYRSDLFLTSHIRDCMNFYAHSWDHSGEMAGFFHYFDDTGVVTDTSHRHLVSSTRFIFTNAMAYQEFKEAPYKLAAEHGMRYLRGKHRNAATGGYCWTLRDGEVEDATNHCYGVAFALLAYAKAFTIGISKARAYMEETWELLETQYWDDSAGLYRDEADSEWNFTAYRGQNANMHMCEALLAAYRACGESKYLSRAMLLARHMTQRQAQLTGTPFIWEHYDQGWAIDWTYNLDDPKHTFRPWGYQPGHQIQWAKLCLLLHQQDPSASWLTATAVTI